jgi:hypothetical protein
MRERASPPPGADTPSSARASATTDFPSIPRTSAEFDAVHSAPSSAEVARAKRPFAPLPAGESAPTMAQLWAHAQRRYGRYQGYAWSGVVVVAGVAYGLSEATKKPKDDASSARDARSRP